MTQAPRIPLLLLILLALATPVFAQDAAASAPWDQPAFASDPRALLAAAQAVPTGDADLIVLLDERTHVFEESGRSRTTWRLMYRVVAESAVGAMGQIHAPWVPWVSDRPKIVARVVTKDGTVHALDEKAVVEAPAGETSLDIFSDSRVLRAPLPAIAVDSVVEYTISFTSNNPIADAGLTDTFYLGVGVPLQRARLVLDTPPSIEPRIVNTTDLKPVVSEAAGRKKTVFESGRIEAIRDYEPHLPYDVAPAPYIAFSTGKTWQEIASRYSDIVDQQIAGSDLKAMVRSAVGKATDRREIIARILASIQKDIRYAGVEVGEGSIIPRTPKTVLTNKYGDCKDKATLLVAMLREAGLDAHVALLRAGADFDVHPDLPGISRFNHAIAVVEGSPQIWIDPTDEFARAAEVPLQDQGRMALIAAKSTKALAKVPEADAAANRVTETRTFELPEDGKARIVELTEATGFNDAWQRRTYASSDRTRFRESMENYVKSYYVAKSMDKLDATDPRDLTKPFRITLEIAESSTGVVGRGEAQVAVYPGGLVSALPRALRDYKQPGPNDDPEKVAKKRTKDFLFPAPGVKEWIYRIDPPAGFVPRTLPPNETRKLGTTTLTTEYSTQSDGVVIAKLRFDTGKRRLDPSELEETRIAISKLLEGDRVIIGFESVGQAKLNAGDIGGAITELHRLAELHPTHAQHHIDLARTLLAGGLGDAAREEIRRAISIEPSNANAYDMQARILQHDVLGRPLRKGFDRTGAIAAFRKAKDLDPKDVDHRAGLAKALLVGEDGVEFGRNADLTGAIAEYRSLIADLGPEGKPFEAELMLALAHAGKFTELRDLTQKMDRGQQRDLGRILSVATIDGTDAALRELGAFDVATRRSYATAVAQTLLALRMYPQAAVMFDAAAQGNPKAAEMRAFIETIRKVKRIEELQIPADDPAGIVQQLFGAMLRNDVEEVKKMIPADVAAMVAEVDRDPFDLSPGTGQGEMPLPVLADVATASLQVQKEGDDKIGYRIRARSMMGNDTQDLLLFVTRENGRYMIRGISGAPDLLGNAALRFAEAGELDRARTWLNWFRDEVQAAGGDDPLRGPSFPVLWPKSKQNATLDEIRTAAASLMLRMDTKRSEAILLEMREKSTNADVKVRIDHTLAAIYGGRKEWDKVVTVSKRVLDAYPDSITAFMTYTTALAQAGKTAEAEKIAKARLEKLPNDRDALRALSQIAAKSGDWNGAHSYAEQLIEKLSPERFDYNNAAWYALFANTGKGFEKALEQARYASENADASALHTLAALYAEAGNSIEARDALLRSMDQRGEEDPTGIDWYVLGRIAENYGIRDAALAAYAKVDKDAEDEDESIMVLTQRRLKALKKP